MPRLMPANRSNGTKREPASHYVRFTEAENSRLHRAAGTTPIARFLREAAMVAIAESERKRRDSEDFEDRRRKSRSSDGDENETVGLGFRPRERKSERVEIEAAATPQVVINNAPSASSSGDIARIAEFVVNGKEWGRSERLRRAKRAIAGTSASPEESARLGKALDDKIAQIDGGSGDWFERIRKGIFE